MVAVTGFLAWSQSERVLADAHGNNIAFLCLQCSGPVLATLLEHQRGSSVTKPTACRRCDAAFLVEAQPESQRLVIHRVPTSESGRYIAGRAPQLTAEKNAASWSVVAAMLAAYGGAGYEELVAAVRQHDHPSGGKGFIDYCVRNGWLQ
jgi:hypothetical protein